LIIDAADFAVSSTYLPGLAHLRTFYFMVKQICRSFLLSGGNVPWPRRMLTLSHVKYALC